MSAGNEPPVASVNAAQEYMRQKEVNHAELVLQKWHIPSVETWRKVTRHVL